MELLIEKRVHEYKAVSVELETAISASRQYCMFPRFKTGLTDRFQKILSHPVQPDDGILPVRPQRNETNERI